MCGELKNMTVKKRDVQKPLRIQYVPVGASVPLTPIQPNNFQAILIWPDAPFKK
jgi:hypothetical protein